MTGTSSLRSVVAVVVLIVSLHPVFISIDEKFDDVVISETLPSEHVIGNLISRSEFP